MAGMEIEKGVTGRSKATAPKPMQIGNEKTIAKYKKVPTMYPCRFAKYSGATLLELLC